MNVIELIHCPRPHDVLRAAAQAHGLAGLAAALAPREVELPDAAAATIQPGTVELPGARVHVIPLQQEMRADGTLTPPAAVVIVDGPEADQVAAELDEALLASATLKSGYVELADGVRVVLDGPSLAETGARRAPAQERLARLGRAVGGLEPVRERE